MSENPALEIEIQDSNYDLLIRSRRVLTNSNECPPALDVERAELVGIRRDLEPYKGINFLLPEGSQELLFLLSSRPVLELRMRRELIL